MPPISPKLRRRVHRATPQGWLPSQASGLVLWMQADQGVVSKTARQFTLANLEFFTVADNASLSTGDIDFTIGMWVYLDSKTTSRGILSKWIGGSNREYQIRYNQTADRFQFLVHDGSIEVTEDADVLGSPSTATWYYIVCWHDSVENTINVQINDGTPDSQGHTTGLTDTIAPFDLATSDSRGSLWDGRTARLGFWKRVLTTAERTELYNAGSGIPYSGLSQTLKNQLISYWDLGEGSGDAIDSHGTNNLTDINTVTSEEGPGPNSITDGSPVSSWTGISGFSKVFSQIGIKRPTYKENIIGGKAVLRFDGTDDLLVLAERYLTISQGLVISVYQLSSSPSDSQTILSTADEGASSGYVLIRGFRTSGQPNLNLVVWPGGGNPTNNFRGSTSLVADTPYIASMSSSGSAYTLRLNGVTETKVLLTGSDDGVWFDATTNTDNLVIGARKQTTEDEFFKGDLAELIVYDNELDAENTGFLESYLSRRYRINLAA